MEKVAVATIEAAAVKTAAMMAELAEVDITDGKGGGSGRGGNGGIVVGTLVCK
jgi:hypothetical protein